MALLLRNLRVVEGPGPPRLRDGMPGPLVKGLPQELRRGPTEMNPLALAAALLHRRDATEGLQFAGTGKALPLGASAAINRGSMAAPAPGKEATNCNYGCTAAVAAISRSKAAMCVRSTLISSSNARTIASPESTTAAS